MPYYSVLIQGDDARTVAPEIKDSLRGKKADYTGHPIFFVDSHRLISDFRQTVEGMLPAGHKAIIRKITKAEYEWNVPKK